MKKIVSLMVVVTLILGIFTCNLGLIKQISAETTNTAASGRYWNWENGINTKEITTAAESYDSAVEYDSVLKAVKVTVKDNTVEKDGNAVGTQHWAGAVQFVGFDGSSTKYKVSEYPYFVLKVKLSNTATRMGCMYGYGGVGTKWIESADYADTTEWQYVVIDARYAGNWKLDENATEKFNWSNFALILAGADQGKSTAHGTFGDTIHIAWAGAFKDAKDVYAVTGESINVYTFDSEEAIREGVYTDASWQSKVSYDATEDAMKVEYDSTGTTAPYRVHFFSGGTYAYGRKFGSGLYTTKDYKYLVLKIKLGSTYNTGANIAYNNCNINNMYENTGGRGNFTWSGYQNQTDDYQYVYVDLSTYTNWGSETFNPDGGLSYVVATLGGQTALKDQYYYVKWAGLFESLSDIPYYTGDYMNVTNFNNEAAVYGNLTGGEAFTDFVTTKEYSAEEKAAKIYVGDAVNNYNIYGAVMLLTGDNGKLNNTNKTALSVEEYPIAAVMIKVDPGPDGKYSLKQGNNFLYNCSGKTSGGTYTQSITTAYNTSLGGWQVLKHDLAKVAANDYLLDERVGYWTRLRFDFLNEDCDDIVYLAWGGVFESNEAIDAYKLKYDHIDERHTITKVQANKSTCKENGNKEHYICEDCNKYYLDEQCVEGEVSYETDIKLGLVACEPGNWNEVTPASYENSGLAKRVCTACGEDYDTKPIIYIGDTNGSHSTNICDLVYLNDYLVDSINNPIASDAGALDGVEGITVYDLDALRALILAH